MSGCAHARMGSLGPHPSPECEDARPSLPALRSGWAILILRGRDHGLITTPNHTTTSWRVNRAILHNLSESDALEARSGVPARCAVCGSRAPRPWPLARATRPIFHRFISHMPYRLSFYRAGVSYYCKHRVMKSARLDYYTELDHVDFLEKRLDLHVGLSVD